jgi:hypothetical protein
VRCQAPLGSGNCILFLSLFLHLLLCIFWWSHKLRPQLFSRRERSPRQNGDSEQGGIKHPARRLNRGERQGRRASPRRPARAGGPRPPVHPSVSRSFARPALPPSHVRPDTSTRHVRSRRGPAPSSWPARCPPPASPTAPLVSGSAPRRQRSAASPRTRARAEGREAGRPLSAPHQRSSRRQAAAPSSRKPPLKPVSAAPDQTARPPCGAGLEDGGAGPDVTPGALQANQRSRVWSGGGEGRGAKRSCQGPATVADSGRASRGSTSPSW